MSKLHALLATGVATCLITACGGGSGDNNEIEKPIPIPTPKPTPEPTPEPVNTAPRVIGSLSMFTQLGAKASLAVSLEDSENDTLTIDLKSAPEFLSYSVTDNSLVIDVTTESFFEIGEHSIELEVSDGQLSSNYTLTLNIEDSTNRHTSIDLEQSALMGAWETTFDKAPFKAIEITPDNRAVLISTDGSRTNAEYSHDDDGFSLSIKNYDCVNLTNYVCDQELAYYEFDFIGNETRNDQTLIRVRGTDETPLPAFNLIHTTKKLPVVDNEWYQAPNNSVVLRKFSLNEQSISMDSIWLSKTLSRAYKNHPIWDTSSFNRIFFAHYLDSQLDTWNGKLVSNTSNTTTFAHDITQTTPVVKGALRIADSTHSRIDFLISVSQVSVIQGLTGNLYISPDIQVVLDIPESMEEDVKEELLAWKASYENFTSTIGIEKPITIDPLEIQLNEKYYINGGINWQEESDIKYLSVHSLIFEENNKLTYAYYNGIEKQEVSRVGTWEQNDGNTSIKIGDKTYTLQHIKGKGLSQQILITGEESSFISAFNTQEYNDSSESLWNAVFLNEQGEWGQYEDESSNFFFSSTYGVDNYTLSDTYDMHLNGDITALEQRLKARTIDSDGRLSFSFNRETLSRERTYIYKYNILKKESDHFLVQYYYSRKNVDKDTKEVSLRREYSRTIILKRLIDLN